MWFTFGIRYYEGYDMNKCVRVCKSKRNNAKDCERDQKFSFLVLLLSFLGVSCIRNQAKEISLVS
ncbi:hypothetical protein BS585_13595 [Vibrio parahaemolyticus]|nr:hypothetical protein BS585_13595 [Vibrio parahaemolyticus]